ncbi:MAG: hypothetical protein ACLPPF_08115 [Rhodomicrobium sp.]
MRFTRVLLAGLVLASAATAVFADILPGPRPRRPYVAPEPAPSPEAVPTRVKVTGATANAIVRMTGPGRSALSVDCEKSPEATNYTCVFVRSASTGPGARFDARPGPRFEGRPDERADGRPDERFDGRAEEGSDGRADERSDGRPDPRSDARPDADPYGAR